MRLRLRSPWSLILAFLAVAAIYVTVPPLIVAGQMPELKHELTTVRTDLHQKKFQQLDTQLGHLHATLATVQDASRLLFYLRVIPHYGALYANSMQLLAGGVDITQGAAMVLQGVPGDLTHHKIPTLTALLTAWKPKIMPAMPWIKKASLAWSRVDARELPGPLQSRWALIHQIQQLMPTVIAYAPALASAGPTLAQLMGEQQSQRYLVMFENSGELRATGGFMTAYGYLVMTHGKVSSVSSQNIYTLSSQVRYRPLASMVIHRYLYLWHWHLRDSNWSPNVPTAVHNIYKFYDSVPGAPHVNGTLLVTTWFVDRLLQDVGPVTVQTNLGPITVTAQNANYEMEYMAEKSGLSQSQRKAFISVMMKSILDKAFHAHGVLLEKILTTVIQGFQQKLLLANFNAAPAQNLLNTLHWAGTLDKHVSGNYLEVVDENLGGHKDNYFIHESVQVSVKKVGAKTFENVKITWVNPAPPDGGWMVVPYTAWIRLYLPTGTKLLHITGENGPIQQYNNTSVNKTVIGTHVTVPNKPSATAPASRGSLTYSLLLPNHLMVQQLTLQKQPGVRQINYQINVLGIKRQLNLYQDTMLAGL